MEIKFLRKKYGYSLEQVAEKMGTSNQTISNWENSKTEPDINSLIKLAELFHCSIDYLITGKELHDEYVLMKKDDYNSLCRYNNSIQELLKNKL